MSFNMMYKFNVVIKCELEPRHDEDEECLSKEHVLIKLEMIVIDNLLVGVGAAETKMVDLDAEIYCKLA